jgi:hypothetical protein
MQLLPNRLRSADEQQSAYRDEAYEPKLSQKARATSTISQTKCRNCFNQGHTTEECNTNACYRCGTWNEHKSSECPTNKKSSKRQTKTEPKKKTNKTKRSKQKEEPKNDESESDSESDDSSYDTAEETEKSGFKRTRFNKRITSTSNSAEKETKSANRLSVVDSGSEEHIVRDQKDLRSIAKRYKNQSETPIHINAANGTRMRIIATGKIAENIKHNAFVSPDLPAKEPNLISGPKLQRQGCYIIMPPTDNQTNVGCIITDGEGYVMGVTKKDLLIDPENIITTDKRISVPNTTNKRLHTAKQTRTSCLHAQDRTLAQTYNVMDGWPELPDRQLSRLLRLST